MVKVPDFYHSSYGTLGNTRGDMFVLCDMLTAEQISDYEKQGCTVGTARIVFDAGTSKRFTDFYQSRQTLFVPDYVDYEL